jgi:hypothetical protein
MADPADPADESEGAPEGGEAKSEEVDPELVALAEERERGSALRPVLFVAVIVLGVWVLADFWPDLKYFFSGTEPTELGSVHDEYAREAQKHPERKVDLPHNTFATIRGIPKRRSQSDQYRFFRLVGAPIYAQTPRENEAESLAERVGESEEGSVDREYFDGAGRLVALWKMPERFQGIKNYYRKHYGTRFCGNLSEKQRSSIRERQRTTYIENTRQEYENATEEEREEQNLEPEPTEEEIQQVLESNPVCVKAYLLLDGESPRSSWRILALAALFGIFILLNIYWLIRWFQNFFGPEVDPSELEPGT